MTIQNDYPSNWNQIRKEVYHRDDYTCQNCGAKGGPQRETELHAHHIVPKSKGGKHNPSNLQTVCKDCHNAIHGSSLAPTATKELNQSIDTDADLRRKRRQKHIPYDVCPLCDEDEFYARDTEEFTFFCGYCNTIFAIPARTTEIIQMNSEYVRSESYIHDRVLMEYSFPTYIWEQFSEFDDIEHLDIDAIDRDFNKIITGPKQILFIISIFCVLFVLSLMFDFIMALIYTSTYLVSVLLIYEAVFGLTDPSKEIDVADYHHSD